MADFDESDIPKEVPAHEDYEAEPENVIRGHKAAIANPNVSEQAKERSRKVLEQYDEPYDESTASHDTTQQTEKDPGNVARGLKASISNPGVSDEAKKKAKEKLQALE
ncbi:conidiation-specific expression protein [Madurella fahalii]|uniref:Conidiation-specific expression protein n=1 Tax=Madurella fahalii TaxID=1157608 RepID=A0ABQ0GQA1_9PEZI